MRLSILDHDPDYSPDAVLYRVYLDGEEIQGVVTADEEKGYVVRYITDEEGNVQLNGDEFDFETVFGEVRLEKRLNGG